MSWLLALALAAEPEVESAGMEAYVAQRLDVVRRPVSTVYAPGYDGSGEFWFVTRGKRRMSAVRFAEAVGELDEARKLRRRRSWTAVGGATAIGAGIGAGALGTTVVARFLDDEVPPQSYAYFAASLAGVLGGTFALSRNARTTHPSALYTEEEATQRARDTNAALRDELLAD